MTDTTTWQIDPAHSAVEFAVKHMMFTTVRGRFKDVKGTIQVDEADPNRSTVSVEIAAASIDTGVADRDTHLRSADFLDAEHHPVITFRSKRVEGAMKKEGDAFKVIGDLSIRGKAGEVALNAVYLGSGKDPWGNTKAGVEASAKVDRREWGLVWNQALETGGILVGNEIRIELQIQAAKVV
ncbi:MAG TPA: YceI family protein [Thermoanaerobaculia bacterium]|jgi:polyisoprenoid-binding protein YceI|nr:YceI family protein [Thermoanaerobaculia bacterium]